MIIFPSIESRVKRDETLECFTTAYVSIKQSKISSNSHVVYDNLCPRRIDYPTDSSSIVSLIRNAASPTHIQADRLMRQSNRGPNRTFVRLATYGQFPFRRYVARRWRILTVHGRICSPVDNIPQWRFSIL